MTNWIKASKQGHVSVFRRFGIYQVFPGGKTCEKAEADRSYPWEMEDHLEGIARSKNEVINTTKAILDLLGNK